MFLITIIMALLFLFLYNKPMSNIIIHSCPSLKLAKTRKNIIINRECIKTSAFLKNYAKGKKYYVYTHGCQANYRDSEIYKGMLAKIGYIATNNIKDADLILINTCAVRENAENKVLGEIGNLKNLKKNREITIVITGCMAMEETIVDKLIKIYPHVDIILGTHDIADFLNILEECLRNKKRVVDVHSDAFNIHEGLPSVRDSNFKAFVNITYGCDNFCTYCIVPYTRGRQRSRDINDIISECQSLIKQGYKEITLLGQNVDSYGKDLKNKITFAHLLDKVADLNIPRLSFLTSHPYDFSLDIIDVMKKHNNILRYLHLPVQSGDDHILKLMNRKYNENQYLSLIKNIKKQLPEVAISTDIIVGFPNESTIEFNNTLKLIKEVKYDSAFTFIYSKRSGTPAAIMDDSVSYQEKVKRFKKLTAQLEKDIEENNQRYIGKVFDVLVDNVSKNDKTMLSGRLNTNKLINFKGPSNLIGQIVKIEVLSSHIHFLIGELVK